MIFARTLGLAGGLALVGCMTPTEPGCGFSPFDGVPVVSWVLVEGDPESMVEFVGSFGGWQERESDHLVAGNLVSAEIASDAGTRGLLAVILPPELGATDLRPPSGTEVAISHLGDRIFARTAREPEPELILLGGSARGDETVGWAADADEQDYSTCAANPNTPGGCARRYHNKPVTIEGMDRSTTLMPGEWRQEDGLLLYAREAWSDAGTGPPDPSCYDGPQTEWATFLIARLEES